MSHRATPVALLVAGVLLTGCLTPAVPTAAARLRRPSETSTLKVQGARLFRVDAEAFESDTKVVPIEPGLHSVAVFLSDGQPDEPAGRRYSREPLAACFEAQTGILYRVRPVYENKSEWWPEVIDDQTGQRVSTTVVDGVRPNCSPVPVAGAPGAPPADVSTPPAETGAAGGQSAVAISRPSSHFRIEKWQTEEQAMRPVASARLISGLGFGGKRLATVTFADGHNEALRAGDGFHLGLGLAWTPIWRGDAVGLGAGFDAGMKYAWVGADNGRISLLSFPLVLAVHSLFPLGTRWSFLVRGGAEMDVAPQLSGEGLAAGANASLSSNVGLMGEAGATYANVGAVGYGFSGRFSWIEYTYGGTSIPAWNAGAMFWISYDIGP